MLISFCKGAFADSFLSLDSRPGPGPDSNTRMSDMADESSSWILAEVPRDRPDEKGEGHTAAAAGGGVSLEHYVGISLAVPCLCHAHILRQAATPCIQGA